MNGDINRNDSARILRDGKVLFSTKIGSMKHLKDNVNKVTAGMEFGITLQGFNDLRVDDVIQCYKIVESKII
jgi:translation initiation factor IF-2